MGLFKYLLEKNLAKPGNEFARQIYENIIMEQAPGTTANNGATTDRSPLYEVEREEVSEPKRSRPDLPATDEREINPNERIDRWLHDQPIITTRQRDTAELETDEDNDVTLNLVEQRAPDDNDKDSADDSDKTDDGLMAADLRARNSILPDMSLIGSDVFDQPLKVDENNLVEEQPSLANSSMFDNDSIIAPLRKKQTAQNNGLNIDMMNNITSSPIGLASTSTSKKKENKRPVEQEEVEAASSRFGQFRPMTSPVTGPKKKRQRWTAEEDELIHKGFFKYKNHNERWRLVKIKYFAESDRTNVQIKDRAQCIGLH